MLHKLLKYNLRAVYRQLMIFYSIALACAIISRCFNNYGDNLILKIIHEFFNGASIGLCVGILINSSTRIWEYTKRDFYGDQSYLTHTLPLSRPQLYCAKFVTILLTLLTSALVIAIILLIDYASPELWAMIDQLIYDCGSKAEFIKFTILIIGVFLLELIFITQVGVTGIILGHKANNHKVLLSFAYGFALFIFCNILTVALANLWGTFDSEVSRMIHQGFSTNSVMEKLLFGGAIAYTIYIIGTYYIGQRALQNGIDVE